VLEFGSDAVGRCKGLLFVDVTESSVHEAAVMLTSAVYSGLIVDSRLAGLIDGQMLKCTQVTVVHSMQAGYMEKAQKYTDKAFMQIEKLRSMYCSLLLIRRSSVASWN